VAAIAAPHHWRIAVPARWLAVFVCLVSWTSGAAAREADAAERGKYLFRAAGGCTCHTDFAGGGAFLAGGRPIKTPFGTFYGPNITPDRETGIGGWNDSDFIRAMRDGVTPKGAHYFPAFPYTSFTNITDGDLHDLKAYLDTVPPVARRNTAHEVAPPFGWRFSVGPWKRLFFKRGPFQPATERSARWNRGAYIVTALAHCGECHTPRNTLGGPDKDMYFAGAVDGPEGRRSPNITPHKKTGIGRWSAADLVTLLKTRMKPDFDDVQGPMAEAIEQGYRFLSDADLGAIAEYVLSLPAIDNQVPSKSESATSKSE
jgi:mono/diheme cytochrome c family protein